ncbi:MAG TPA: hypothetical protein VK045_12340, partial [Ornithinicoccus sp.]|nr:hypothetical protein [Ornithinicoccus sp.]
MRYGALVTSAFLIVTAAPVAVADDYVPSQEEVQQAKQLVADTEGRVGELDALMLDYTSQLRSAQQAAEVADEAAAVARYEADTAAAEAERLGEDAAAARVEADAAQQVLGRHAAEAYKSGGLSTLELLLSAGPEDLMERAGSLEVVSRIRARDASAASQASGTADALEREAALAAAQAEAAAVRADEA